MEESQRAKRINSTSSISSNEEDISLKARERHMEREQEKTVSLGARLIIPDQKENALGSHEFTQGTCLTRTSNAGNRPSSGFFNVATRDISTVEFGNFEYTAPPEPLLGFSSSLAFSDISLPFPQLTSSATFGSVFSGKNLTSHLGAPSLQHATSYGQNPASNLSLIHTPPNCEQARTHDPTLEGYQTNTKSHSTLVTAGDLTLAANALLDLTPAIEDRRSPFSEWNLNTIQREVTFSVENPHYRKDDGNLTQVQVIKANFAARTKRLLNNVPYTNLSCKCKNSHCLKLYCNCFQTGTICDELICKCKDCQNTMESSGPRGNRTRAIHEILNRRIDAFEPRLKKKKGEGCSCKKSRCLQKYCDCFALGSACSSKCICFDCSNIPVTARISSEHAQSSVDTP